jgi:hypothetical protein
MSETTDAQLLRNRLQDRAGISMLSHIQRYGPQRLCDRQIPDRAVAELVKRGLARVRELPAGAASRKRLRGWEP